MPQPSLPAEFDAKIYRKANPDLRRFDDSGLEKHYREYGRREGRQCSRVTDRLSFFALVGIQGSIPVSVLK